MNTKSLTFTGLFAALVFIFTFTFKIPVGGVLGYAHLGDMFIIISAWMLGRKYAPYAAAIGAALADFASGFAVWVLPTLIVKFVFTFVICIIAEKVFDGSYRGYLAGTAAGMVVHIAGYSLAWYIIGGAAGVAASIIPLVLQTVIGFVLGNIAVNRFSHSKNIVKLQKMARGQTA